MPAIPFDAYLASLGRLTGHIDPTNSTPEAEEIREIFDSLASLPNLTLTTIAAWASTHPKYTYVLALAAGVSRERFRNQLRDWFGTTSGLELQAGTRWHGTTPWN